MARRSSLAAALSVAIVVLACAGCAKDHSASAEFCDDFASTWNAFANRPADADTPSARDAVIEFWQSSREQGVSDTLDETLKIDIRNLRTALSETGYTRRDAISSLENGLGIVAQECAKNGHPITYIPAAQAIPPTKEP